MGREVVKAVANDSRTELAGAVSPRHANRDAGELAGLDALGVFVDEDLGRAIQRVGSDAVAVDFSVPSTVKSNIHALLHAKIAPVVGTTGLSESDLSELDEAAKRAQTPLLIAPNFAIGAILMMRFAQESSKYFDAAEIIEFHHERKLDAPSGTAFQTARLMREAKGEDFTKVGGDESGSVAPGSRGGDLGGIAIHSVRLAGYLAHQEVIFGMAGQTLTLRHDTITRECYMPGVLLAITKVKQLPPGLTFGLEHIM